MAKAFLYEMDSAGHENPVLIETDIDLGLSLTGDPDHNSKECAELTELEWNGLAMDNPAINDLIAPDFIWRIRNQRLDI